jgi:hypothetical protein
VAEDKRREDERVRLKMLSEARAASWSNTLSAARVRKEAAREERLVAEEAAREEVSSVYRRYSL